MSGEQPSSSRNADEELKAFYQEVCRSHQGIADFRAKLLGFLPLASGTGIFLFLNLASTTGTKQYLLPIGVFGFVVTLGLAFYEIRGIQECNSLRRGGHNIEELLGIYGQFRLHPPRVYGVIGNTLAASVIYPAVLAAWTFIALVSVVGFDLWTFVLALFVLCIGCIVFYNLDLTKGVEEEPNKSSVLRKMLNHIDPNLQADPKVETSIRELKECLEKLSQKKRAPTQKEWQKLCELTKDW